MKEAASAAVDGLNEYLHQIGRYENLEAEDELRLGRQVQAGLTAEWDMAQKEGELTAAELEELQERADTGQLAAEQFIHANLRYVVSLARRYKRKRTPLLDAIQYGNLGLIDAVYSFNPELGFRFTTHANWRIRSEITRGMRVSDDDTVVSHRARHRLIQLNKYATDHTGRLRSDEELAELLGISGEKLRNFRLVKANLMNSASLDEPLKAGGETSRSEFLADDSVYGSVEELVVGSAHFNLQDMLGALTKRQYEVIALRYGLATGQVITQEKAAETLGLSRQAVSQIEARAIERLRTQALARQVGDTAIGIR